MLLPLIVGVLASPAVLSFTNRVIEEYILPRKTLKDAAAGKVELYPVALDMALTTQELHQLKKNGSFNVLQAGCVRHSHIAKAGVASVCGHCKRLKD